MKSIEALLSFLRNQAKKERTIADSIDQSLRGIANPAVKGTLKGISLDSMKHAEMYDAAIDLLTASPTALSQELSQYDYDKQKKLVEDHIKIEAELVEAINEVVPTLKNRKVKLLLGTILQDEKRHHELLKRVLKVLVQGETMKEEFWEILWTEHTPRW